MNRRGFIALVGGAAAAWPLAAWGQQANRVRSIGALFAVPENNPEGQVWLSAFVQSLASLGWTSGGNVRIETRWTGGDANKVKAYAAELVALKPDIILAAGSVGVSALHKETRAIPIVAAQIVDPVNSGLVASLAHPGGNITGFMNFEDAIGGKWLATLKDVAPGIDRVIVMLNPNNLSHGRLSRTIETSALSLGIGITAATVRSTSEIERVFNEFAPNSQIGMIVLPDTVTVSNANRIIALAAQHRLPAVYAFRYFTAAGGLVSYGSDQADLYRRAAFYVDRILRGTNPADLPVEVPTKFELVINLKTAKAMGLTVPPTVLIRADEVIE
ncbi:MAG TPA: ABC transporter substrate-binding protein [Pseudolabrys sp.]|nr:ABC transporter substrate-binding protein [Pseudolabrys sp.]